MFNYLVIGINKKKQFPLRHLPPVTSYMVWFDIILSLYMFANHVRYGNSDCSKANFPLNK